MMAEEDNKTAVGKCPIKAGGNAEPVTNVAHGNAPNEAKTGQTDTEISNSEKGPFQFARLPKIKGRPKLKTKQNKRGAKTKSVKTKNSNNTALTSTISWLNDDMFDPDGLPGCFPEFAEDSVVHVNF